MEKDGSLLDIMNDVSRILDTQPAAPLCVPRGVMAEIDAFIALDPLLASLNKQYLDAKAHRICAEKEFGASDGMTDMAVILEDSAWCAMQTRYMEVRRDRAMMASVQKLMEESRLAEEAGAKAEKEKHALKMFEQMQIYLYMREAKKSNEAIYLWLAVMFLCSGRNQTAFPLHYAAHHFNRLAA